MGLATLLINRNQYTLKRIALQWYNIGFCYCVAYLIVKVTPNTVSINNEWILRYNHTNDVQLDVLLFRVASSEAVIYKIVEFDF